MFSEAANVQIATQATTEVAADSVADILRTISIPPCPAVVATLMEEARQAEVDFQKIIRLITGDLSLAASMMKTANSPIFALRNKVETVQKAATVLGLKNILSIVNGLALKRSLTPKGVSMERFWERSSFHATVSTRLARRVPGVTQEDAYTFGLFHDCGIPILMQRFPDYKDTLLHANRSAKAVWETETERHGTDHVTVGAMLAHNWHLPDLIVNAIRLHHNLEILSDGSAHVRDGVRALAAVSLLADHLIARFLDAPDEAEWMAHGSTALNYLNFDEEELEELQSDVEEDLNAIRLDRG
jgi:HD-like signal output (HDOD) protein